MMSQLESIGPDERWAKFTDSRDLFTAAVQLHNLLIEILEDEIKCVGDVSLKACCEVIIHHSRDVGKLFDVQPKGVEATKFIGYLAFWVRKIKPLSNAYSIVDVAEVLDDENKDPDISWKEITQINELASIEIVKRLLHSYVVNPDSKLISGSPDVRLQVADRALAIMDGYLTIDTAHDEFKNFKDIMVYDMRFRTFGPHHMVHIINHILYAADN